MAVFTVSLERGGGVPMYEQLYRYIREEIVSGRIKCGERLMSKKAAARHLGVSVITVETAYSMLMQEGYIKSRAKSGYYVCRTEEPFGLPEVRVPVRRSEVPEKRYPYDFKTNTVDVNSFPFSVWIKLSKEIMYNNHELLNLGEGQGESGLREEIAKYLHEVRAVSCGADGIVVGAGIEYLLMILCELLGESSVIGVENPSYPKTVAILKNSKCRIKYISLDDEGINMESLEKSGANIVYITPSHQFPTGIVMSARRRAQLLAWAYRAENRYIIEDDYNGEFNFIGKPIPSVQGMDTRGRVIYMSTFSRVLAPSVRIAYMALPYELAERYRQQFKGYSPTVSRFEQHTLERFISGGYMSRHLARVKNIYRKRRDMLVSCIRRILPEAHISGDRAGVHLIVSFDGAEELAARLQNEGVRLYGMSGYYSGGGEDAFVAGYGGMSEADIQKAMEIVERVKKNMD